MKELNRLFVLLLICILFSCTNAKKESSKEETKSKIDTVSATQIPAARDSVKAGKDGNDSSEMKYVFANDSICQELTIRIITRNKTTKIPDKLSFRLIFHNKGNNSDDKQFEGIAKMVSANESFSDSTDKDGGDYFAADYDFTGSNFKIQIRLDIQSFEACLVFIEPETVLGRYGGNRQLLSNAVLKRGVCK